jgi:hypothetical protein
MGERGGKGREDGWVGGWKRERERERRVFWKTFSHKVVIEKG